MKKIILTEAEKKAIILNREKSILENFAKTFNKIKRLDENEIQTPGTEEIELDENLLGKGMLAGLLMTMGTTWSQIKPEYKKQIDSIQRIETLTPQEKRAEIIKIAQMNRDEIIAKKREDFLRTMAAAGFTDEEEYKKYLKKLHKKGDVALSDMEGPNFSSTRCGISKAAAKQSKKDWKSK